MGSLRRWSLTTARKGHRKAWLTGVVRAVPIGNCSNETGTGNTLVSTLQACRTRYSVNTEQGQPDSFTQLRKQSLIWRNLTLTLSFLRWHKDLFSGCDIVFEDLSCPLSWACSDHLRVLNVSLFVNWQRDQGDLTGEHPKMCLRNTNCFANVNVSVYFWTWVSKKVSEFLTDWFLVSRLLKLSENTVFVSDIWMVRNEEEWRKYDQNNTTHLTCRQVLF